VSLQFERVSNSGKGVDSLVALMLGRLRMNVSDAIEALINVATAIFPEGSQEVANAEANSRKLREAIEDMLQTRGLGVKTKMYERHSPQTGCKVLVHPYGINYTYNSLRLGFCTRQHQRISDIHKPSVPILFVARVLTHLLSMQCAPPWLSRHTFYQ
jgi:hypothetical protein